MSRMGRIKTPNFRFSPRRAEAHEDQEKAGTGFFPRRRKDVETLTAEFHHEASGKSVAEISSWVGA
jgi:hypothetical protein